MRATAPTKEAVIGRLAPSPTGRLHVGNLSSSLLAWIQARASGGRLIMRIEDLDPPRCVPGAGEQILDDLRWLGLDWDEGPHVGGGRGPYVQSERHDRYAAAIDALRDRDLVYPCFCSRRDVEEVLSAPHERFDPRTQYPGTCSELPGAVAWERADREPHALRFRATGTIEHRDGVTGTLCEDIAVVPGDFVVRRKDGLYAYQLAVVVDDAEMGVSDVLRGRDLLDSTARQLALFDALRVPRPRTWHVPLLVDERGDRLAKRSAAVAREGLETAGWSAPALVGALARLWGWASEFVPTAVDDTLTLWAPQTLAAPTIRVPDALLAGPDEFARWSRSHPLSP